MYWEGDFSSVKLAVSVKLWVGPLEELSEIAMDVILLPLLYRLETSFFGYYVLDTIKGGNICQTTQESGVPLDSCVGFIDYTKIIISRPGGHGTNQRACYSYHKHMHCLFYQTITTSDWLIFSLYGLEVSRGHEMALRRNKCITGYLQERLVIGGRQYYIYRDTTYVLRPWLQTAFDRA
eukprot:IDg19950t1